MIENNSSWIRSTSWVNLKEKSLFLLFSFDRYNENIYEEEMFVWFMMMMMMIISSFSIVIFVSIVFLYIDTCA